MPIRAGKAEDIRRTKKGEKTMSNENETEVSELTDEQKKRILEHVFDVYEWKSSYIRTVIILHFILGSAFGAATIYLISK